MPDDATDVRGVTDTERLLTVPEAAAVLGVSERTVRRRIAAGKLAAIDAGGQMRVPASAVGVRPPDMSGTPPASHRRTVPVMPSGGPVAVSALEGALVGLVERQAGEIADLRAKLAVVEERLRMVGAGDDVAPERGGTSMPSSVPVTVSGPAPVAPPAPWWRFWERR